MRVQEHQPLNIKQQSQLLMLVLPLLKCYSFDINQIEFYLPVKMQQGIFHFLSF